MKKPEETIINKVLDNLATKEEAKKVAKWFAMEEGLAYLQKRMDKEYKEKINTDYFHTEEKVYASIERKVGRRKRFLNIFRITAILIPFMILSASLWYLNRHIHLFGKQEVVSIATAIGEKTQVVFQDGTKVYLSPKTTLHFPKKFGLTERTVFLNGEAYFDVARNKLRPFSVNMKNTNIKVLGTAFNVKSFDEEREVVIALEEGDIEFNTANKEHQKLEAGEQLRYNKESQEITIDRRKNATINYGGGKNAIIMFNDSSISTVIKTLKRWYAKPFVIQDTLVHRYSYTTSFKNATLADILKELETIAPVQFELHNDTIFVAIRKVK